MAGGRVIQAQFEVTAPMFPGQASTASKPMGAEIRPTAIKAALRFWWRALAYARLGDDVGALRREEDALFGAAADDDGDRGQAGFLMQMVTRPSERHTFPPTQPGGSLQIGRRRLDSGVQYLGYGPILWDQAAKQVRIHRHGILPGTRFSVRFRIRPNVNADTLIAAIKLFGLLGGLGARARRGFGSVRLLTLDVDGQRAATAPDDIPAYVQALQDVIGSLKPADTLPAWTAFCAEGAAGRGTVSVVVEPGDEHPTGNGRKALSTCIADDATDSLDVLNMLGAGMMLYRSWGRNGKIAFMNMPAWQQFQTDHDWFYDFTDRRATNNLPQRIAFGLPLPFFSVKKQSDSREKKGTERKATVSTTDGDRRASPVFFHVHRAGATNFGVVTVFPGVFLPDKVKLDLRIGKRSIDQARTVVDPGVLFDFIDGDGRNNRRQSPFRVADSGWILTGRASS